LDLLAIPALDSLAIAGWGRLVLGSHPTIRLFAKGYDAQRRLQASGQTLPVRQSTLGRIRWRLIFGKLLPIGQEDPRRQASERNVAASSAINFGSGKSISAGEIVEFFERAINHSLLVDVAKDRVRKVDRAFLQADITKIDRATGWTPRVEIQQGITP
jgi:hypothetical protein